MHTQDTNTQFNISNIKNDVNKNKASIEASSDNLKGYIQYIAEIQELLYAKVEEHERFKENIKQKLKG